MKSMLDKLALATVCEEAACPNIGECFHHRTATFLILGHTCTRHCRFCAVEHGTPGSVDSEEPQHLVDAVQQLSLRHVVITPVTRDDLLDGGAAGSRPAPGPHSHASATVEVLIPDFQGDDAALRAVLPAQPEALGHNLEVVPRLYPEIRRHANYRQSLHVLERARQLRPTAYTESGLVVGGSESKRSLTSCKICGARAPIS
jgi:lipoic acid synthetase